MDIHVFRVSVYILSKREACKRKYDFIFVIILKDLTDRVIISLVRVVHSRWYESYKSQHIIYLLKISCIYVSNFNYAVSSKYHGKYCDISSIQCPKNFFKRKIKFCLIAYHNIFIIHFPTYMFLMVHITRSVDTLFSWSIWIMDIFCVDHISNLCSQIYMF